MSKAVLRLLQSPGDMVMPSAAVHDPHMANPSGIQANTPTTTLDFWAKSHLVTLPAEGPPGVEVLDMHCRLIHQNNTCPYDFLDGYAHDLKECLAVRVSLTRIQSEIHLSNAELSALPRRDMG